MLHVITYVTPWAAAVHLWAAAARSWAAARGPSAAGELKMTPKRENGDNSPEMVILGQKVLISLEIVKFT